MITAEELKIDDQENIVKLLNNYDFINSLVAICIDTFCFINGLKIEFKEVLRVSNINYNDYWRIISNFAHFDKDIHISISDHIFNRERGILIYYGWIDGQTFANILNNYQNNNT